jgi:hypothetical protein
MTRIQSFLDVATGTPLERDGRHFRTWQRVSVQVQREVRSLAAQIFFGEPWRAAVNLDRAFTMVVYSSCQPCYGHRPMDFTYDICELAMLSTPLRMIGRNMQARLVQISKRFAGDTRLKRRFLPVWHVDILQSVKSKPRTLIEMLAREASMTAALIDFGTRRDARSGRRFTKTVERAARVLGISSAALQDAVLQTAIENLGDCRILEDGDMIAARGPDARVGGDENRNDRRAHGRGQMADAGIVPDVHARGSDPAGEIVQIFDFAREAPLDAFKLRRDGLKILQRPVFLQAAGIGVNDGEILSRGRRDFNARRGFGQ